MSNVKTDKLAAMAARQQSSDKALEEELSTPVKRDKLAAMAARQIEETITSTTTTTITTVPKRDKFAAMAARPPEHTTTITTEKSSPKNHQQDRIQELQQRCQQRDAIYADLDQAEALVIQLLQVAQDTSTALSTTWAAPPVSQYPTIVQQIQGLLQPYAHYVQAYQAPSTTTRMYQTRVEWRLAEEAKAILQDYRALEETQES